MMIKHKPCKSKKQNVNKNIHGLGVTGARKLTSKYRKAFAYF